MSIALKKGTQVFDHDGTLLATVARDITREHVLRGGHVRSEDFKLSNGEHPIPGDRIPTALVEFVRSVAAEQKAVAKTL